MAVAASKDASAGVESGAAGNEKGPSEGTGQEPTGSVCRETRESVYLCVHARVAPTRRAVMMMAMMRVKSGHERKLASDFGVRQRRGARCATSDPWRRRAELRGARLVNKFTIPTGPRRPALSRSRISEAFRNAVLRYCSA